MKVALTGLALILLTLPATAQTATCKSQADEKKLAGAAMKSFLTKCEKDAKTTCDASASGKDELHEEVHHRRDWGVSDGKSLLKRGNLRAAKPRLSMRNRSNDPSCELH